MKILVIDDEPDITYTVKAMLEVIDESVDVVVTNDPKEGVVLAKKERPDAIFLDIMMPGINGWLVNKQLKMEKETRAIPVIFLTAKTDETSRNMGTEGASSFVTKPFTSKDLENVLKEITHP